MTRLETGAWGAERLRVAPWRDDRTWVITPMPGMPPAPDAVRRTCDRLAAEGVRRVLTSALGPAEQPAFAEIGFRGVERLHLLRHDLVDQPRRPRASLRRARRTDEDAVLAVDHAAFPRFWRFDRSSLAEACAATPSHRFRVVTDAGVAGYSICGRAGATTYLQRLAVHPTAQGRGLGRVLVADVLRWSVRHRSRALLVNTQADNDAALHLYRTMGFVLQPEGLTVMEWVATPEAGR
jgi:ribosomal protein S18 acetylase RimI-like enzyme